jgi:hypothetical protein
MYSRLLGACLTEPQAALCRGLCSSMLLCGTRRFPELRDLCEQAAVLSIILSRLSKGPLLSLGVAAAMGSLFLQDNQLLHITTDCTAYGIVAVGHWVCRHRGNCWHCQLILAQSAACCRSSKWPHGCTASSRADAGML